jgi:hypothetical protein
MFSIDDRDGVCEQVLARAAGDVHAVAGAIVGCLATTESDRWSEMGGRRQASGAGGSARGTRTPHVRR